MNTIWFKRFGWTYIPTTFMGMAVTILAISILPPVFASTLRTGILPTVIGGSYLSTQPAPPSGGNGLPKKQVDGLHLLN